MVVAWVAVVVASKNPCASQKKCKKLVARDAILLTCIEATESRSVLQQEWDYISIIIRLLPHASSSTNRIPIPYFRIYTNISQWLFNEIWSNSSFLTHIPNIEVPFLQIEHFIESPDLLGTLFCYYLARHVVHLWELGIISFQSDILYQRVVHWMCHPCWSSTHAQKMWFHDDLIWQSAYCLLFYSGPHTTLRIAWLIIICHC